jgi:Ser/Thr protein kinase RdoA (MazF antagonist)
VFRDPLALMSNVERVTQHLRDKIVATGGDPARETLTLVPTSEGSSFHRDSAGNYWRAYLFIEDALAYEMAVSLTHVYNAAKAFGRFQRLLADFPAGALHEVLPGFHNTPQRFATFVETVAQDRVNRAGEVREEIEFVEQRAAETAVLVDLLDRGQLPLRVTHNDAKFSNVLMDDRTGEGLCVIDLDTVMPGTALYDFGDAVRAGAALAAEDEPDFTRAGMSLDTFEALTRGYLDAARDFLTPTEIDYLAFAARVITLEQTIRFLNDYVNGDTYYKIHRPKHNLDRTRTQIRMLRDMEEKYEQMVAIVARYR